VSLGSSSRISVVLIPNYGGAQRPFCQEKTHHQP
jgi:hypothetical protein